MTDFSALLGPAERFRPAAPASWQEVEAWVGAELPSDYKALVDGYGDAVLLGHLFLPHPQGGDPLLTFMQEEQDHFHHAYDHHRDSPALALVWDRLVPWAYHDWNGDVCLLVPPIDDEGAWAVAVAFRQCPRIDVLKGGVGDFLTAVLRGGRGLPAGWPGGLQRWQSAEGSPLI
ncbi:hypothetical protein ACTFBT_21490 [Streptomyces microflavus]|uniref:hypothetical protein n=1 Tax=Streptomyces TaxID=1883 RepID=UPI0005170FBB|nr:MULTISPECIES: hypothetical protein [Streptomyces]MCX4653970.1 hypothetical protein [Streptomyces microflavus]MDX2980908.1 hypothetical protein [Streptomyces sp. NRRL_B-2249]WSS35133.1 hypothetical protein OG269_17340 [Streptomyces microflavus]WST16299.1 hypothetical protein OG721_21205 [Streptomyces microflavus]SCK53109.1 hypothetical protein YUYDRAFT_06941 [Streptomyces sp. ScaeMP-e48]